MASLVLKLTESDGPTIRGMCKYGEERYAVYDFINKMCSKPGTSSYGGVTFARLIGEKSEHRAEVLTLCKDLQFPGKGQRPTPTMTLSGLQRLLMILGGKVAAEFRKIVEETFRRVMGGDRSLIQVIEANAASNARIQQAYRASLEEEPASNTLDDLCFKRKYQELEMAERIQKLEESRENTRAKSVETTGKALQNIKTLQEILGGNTIDERTRLQIEDYTKNLVLTRVNTSVIAPTNDAPVTNETDSINVAIVAAEMGFKCSDAEAQLIGKKMAKKYREKYGENPPKHKQFVKGNFIPVNSYMERDRTMMADIIREVME